MAIVDEDPARFGRGLEGVPVVGGVDRASAVRRRCRRCRGDRDSTSIPARTRLRQALCGGRAFRSPTSSIPRFGSQRACKSARATSSAPTATSASARSSATTTSSLPTTRSTTTASSARTSRPAPDASARDSSRSAIAAVRHGHLHRAPRHDRRRLSDRLGGGDRQLGPAEHAVKTKVVTTTVVPTRPRSS